MATLTKASDIDLTPIPGKQYFNLEREWREEFIYFLLVDRFHDDNARSPVLQAGRSNGISTPDDFFGGTIKAITNHLDYMAGLGCTAIWLSPILENNPKAYHGYNINNDCSGQQCNLHPFQQINLVSNSQCNPTTCPSTECYPGGPPCQCDAACFINYMGHPRDPDDE